MKEKGVIVSPFNHFIPPLRSHSYNKLFEKKSSNKRTKGQTNNSMIILFLWVVT